MVLSYIWTLFSKFFNPTFEKNTYITYNNLSNSKTLPDPQSMYNIDKIRQQNKYFYFKRNILMNKYIKQCNNNILMNNYAFNNKFAKYMLFKNIQQNQFQNNIPQNPILKNMYKHLDPFNNRGILYNTFYFNKFN